VTTVHLPGHIQSTPGQAAGVLLVHCPCPCGLVLEKSMKSPYFTYFHSKGPKQAQLVLKRVSIT